jgi:hypothetical protein
MNHYTGPARAPFRPQVEQLEARQLLSAGVHVSGTVLKIVGTSGRDTVLVQDDGSNGPGALTVTLNGATTPITASVITDVQINTFQERDVVVYKFTGTVKVPRNVSIDLGDGNDVCFVQFLAGVANVGNGPGGFTNINVTVNGGAGDDSIDVEVNRHARLDGANLNIVVNGGAGNDGITVDFGGIANGVITVQASGGAGRDHIVLDMQGQLDPGVAGFGTMFAEADGGLGRDFLQVVLDPDTGPETGNQIFPIEGEGFINGGLGQDTAVHTPHVQVTGVEVDQVVS